MANEMINQSDSEVRLHRVLYFIKFLRAMILYNILNLLAVALFLTPDLRNIIHTDTMINSMITQIQQSRTQGYSRYFVVFIISIFSLFFIAFLMCVYIYITKVWRLSLRIQGTFLVVCVLYVPFWAHLKFLFANLHYLFSGILLLNYGLASMICIDAGIALWGVSRSRERSSFIATLDARLATGLWTYVNKLLDFPRTPFRTWKSTAAYVLSLVGAILLIESITYLISFGEVDAKLAQLAASCAPAVSCATQSLGWAQQILLWVVLSLVGVRVAAFMQSAAKTIGGLSVSDVLKNSDDRFVLYLRAFDTDDVTLPKPRLPLLSKLLTMNPFPPRVEEELFDVADGYRPLIAVGRPGTAQSKAGGLAYRAYLDDSDWQSYVVDKIRRADSIVILLRNTDGVRWEVSKVLSEGAASKTLFLFDPVAKDLDIWRTLAKTFLPLFEATGLVAPSFAFEGQPIGFFFEGGELASIENTNWTATSYRTAFSCFLAGRAPRIGRLSAA